MPIYQKKNEGANRISKLQKIIIFTIFYFWISNIILYPHQNSFVNYGKLKKYNRLFTDKLKIQIAFFHGRANIF